MADDISYLQAVLTGGTMAVTGFLAFVSRRFVAKVDATADDLAKHKIEDVGKYATMDQITQVHARITESTKSFEENFRELRSGLGEIKNILISGVHK